MTEQKRMFYVSYRGEFAVVVFAKDIGEAIERAKKKTWWELVGNLWDEYFEVEEVAE